MIAPLTSLRLIFALMVLVSHLGILNEVAFSGHILKEGYVGVSFFFILSGFIIAHNYTTKLAEGHCSRKKVLGSAHCTNLPLASAHACGGHIHRRHIQSYVATLLGTPIHISYANQCIHTTSRFFLCAKFTCVEPVLRATILSFVPDCIASGKKSPKTCPYNHNSSRHCNYR